MEDFLDKLPLDKRDRIINSALQEFAEFGYEKASTNRIVKLANVSKGLLFHYFESKERLFNYLTGFAFDTIVSEIEEVISDDQEDIFERLWKITLAKLQLQEKYPSIYPFILSLYKGEHYEKLIERNHDESSNLLTRVYSENIDFSSFKDSVDLMKTMNIIRWTFEKFSEDVVRQMIQDEVDFNQMVTEFNEYVCLLKLAFYKEGWND